MAANQARGWAPNSAQGRAGHDHGRDLGSLRPSNGLVVETWVSLLRPSNSLVAATQVSRPKPMWSQRRDHGQGLRLRSMAKVSRRNRWFSRPRLSMPMPVSSIVINFAIVFVIDCHLRWYCVGILDLNITIIIFLKKNANWRSIPIWVYNLLSNQNKIKTYHIQKDHIIIDPKSLYNHSSFIKWNINNQKIKCKCPVYYIIYIYIYVCTHTHKRNP